MRFRIRSGRAVAVVVLVLGLAGQLPAADGSGRQALPSEQRVTAFRGGIDLVAVDVCVKDRSGRLVHALRAEDFQVFENSQPQDLSLFVSEARVPLAVTLLIDRSTSMRGEALELAKTAALAFLDQLNDEDEVAVVAFGGHAERLVPLGRDRLAAEQAIRVISPKGQTALYEAVIVGLRELEGAAERRTRLVRSALIVLSDGHDTVGRPGFDYVFDEVRRSGTLIYAVSLRFDRRARALPPVRELTQLAMATGGRALGVASLDRLIPAYEEIAAELRHFYRLGYAPFDPPRAGEWRTISVRVSLPDALVRSRAGYYAGAR